VSPALASALGAAGMLVVVLVLVATYRAGKDEGIKQERRQWEESLARQGWVPESGPIPDTNGGTRTPGGDGGRS
jgi:hypothetical protein